MNVKIEFGIKQIGHIFKWLVWEITKDYKIESIKSSRLMQQLEGRSTEDLFSLAKGMHSSNGTSCVQLQAKLQFMEKNIQSHSSFLNCSFCSRSSKKINQSFKRAFKTLNISQQTKLFYTVCKIIKQIKEKKNFTSQIFQNQQQTLDTTIYIKDNNNYTSWTVTRIKASLKTIKVLITDTSIVIDMRDFLLRAVKKNKHRQSFALEAATDKEGPQTIKISSQGHTFQDTFNFFYALQLKALYYYISALIQPSLIQNQLLQTKPSSIISRKLSIKASNSSMNLDTVSMQEKMMTLKLISPEYAKNSIKIIQKQMLEKQRVIRLRDSSYNDIYKILIPHRILNKIQDVSEGWQKVKESQDYEVYYNREEQKVKKIYRLRSSDIIIFDWIVDELNNFSNFWKWKPKMEKISCLKAFPSQKTKVFHEVYGDGNKKTNYVFIRHHFDEPNNLGKGIRSKRIFYFYDQSIVTSIAKDYFGVSEPLAQISYIIWKFYQQNDTMNLVVEAKCDHFTTPEKNLKMIESYLGDFDSLKNHAANYNHNSEFQDSLILNTVLFENQYIQKIDEIEGVESDTQYFTINEENSPIRSSTKLLQKRHSQLQKTINLSIIQKPQNRVSFQMQDTANQQTLLKFKHPVRPYKKGKPNIITPKTIGGHFHWQNQWQINNKGQLISINKEKIAAQNNVLKTVFKRFGRNLLSGKGITSISLPVDCFGEDSNLSRLCNSYGYGPIFLQEAATMTDPVERMKRVLAFGISATVIYIRMDKPFNPILGETYQSFIDGCPVYGEQISHHPPISAVFFKGRGFTLYGHFQAKVEMSLNSASGINDGQMSVSFHSEDLKKERIVYNGPPGELSGLIYGDRKMSIIKKSYYFDPENLIHCELRWSKQKGKSQQSSNYIDAVEGQIVKLKHTFNTVNWKNVKKDDIQTEYGMIHGRWTGAVYYDDQLLFDTYKLLPHKVEPYLALLQSDVSKRKDLILRTKAVDMEPAQIAKQELEQIQRNDRKLRAKFAKTKETH